jgi:hypothetical protein
VRGSGGKTSQAHYCTHKQVQLHAHQGLGTIETTQPKEDNMNQVWYVSEEETAGFAPTLFDTKEAAEVYARVLFPDETESKRYARIYFRRVLTMADLNGG